ncbi:DUF3857 domain-containing protein [Winogradskyella sp. A3E31]|uniref:DUF3857 domain-containing protein n=1 Tax=Winogradskyella sp. A3E31 TaxID=3349637 RepID=UPI00398B799A
MRKIIFLAIGLLIINNTYSQDFKFGKISEEDLNETIHSIDSSANAAVLYRNENIYFLYNESKGFVQTKEVHERIKIYNKEGYDWSTKKIILYDGGGGKSESVNSLKGATYNIEKGKVVKDRLKNDGIFEEDYNDYSKITTITMPNIQDGSIIEYSYKVISPFLDIDDVIFQYDIPINKFDFSISSPEYYVYNTTYNLKADYLPELKPSKKQSKISISGKTDYVNAGMRNDRSSSGGVLEYEDKILTANEEDIPSLKPEAYAGNINNYRSKLSFELKAILNQYGGIRESYSYNWEDVSKTIYNDSDFGNQLNKSNFFKEDIAPLVDGITNPYQKAIVLQEFIKSKIKWNGFYGYSAFNGVRKSYKEGEGNVADINLTLIAMLRSQGIEANPVLVSTKNNGIPLFPTRKGFNYVICMVENQDGYILLDASEVYSTANVLPTRILNWQGRVIKDNGSSSWVSLRPSNQSAESTFLNVKINDDFSVDGKIRKSITDQSALNYRTRYASMDSEEHIKNLEKGKGDIEITELEVTNARDISKPYQYSYSYTASGVVDDIGDNLYFSPLFFLTQDESPFKLEERKYPIDFVVPIQDKYTVNIMLPENYKVETMPESEIMEFKNGAATFSYVSKVNGKYLQFNIALDINTSLIDPLDYGVFKAFFENMIKKQNEQVVLTKA